MILVTVGTERFDALIAEVDQLMASGVLSGPVLCQIGVGRYEPVHVPFVRYDRELVSRLRTADLIITHAGTGSVCECIEAGQPFITVVDARKVDNHQREFVEALGELYDFCWIEGPDQLAAALHDARPATALGELQLADLANEVAGVLSGSGSARPASSAATIRSAANPSPNTDRG